MELEPIVVAIFFSMCGINLILAPLLVLKNLHYRKALKAFRSVVTTEQRIEVADILIKDADES